MFGRHKVESDLTVIDPPLVREFENWLEWVTNPPEEEPRDPRDPALWISAVRRKR